MRPSSEIHLFAGKQILHASVTARAIPVTAAARLLPPAPARPRPAGRRESISGRRWLGWAAVALLLFASALLLKYDVDNRWIGVLGRVAIGVAAGIALTAVGLKY